MFMDNHSSTEEQLVSTHNNLRTPSPLSSDSDSDGRSESLLSEINEVYNSIESNYELTKTRTFKNLEIIKEQRAPSSAENHSENSSPTSLKKRLSNVSSRLPVPLGYTSRSISKDVFSHLQTQSRIDEKEETEFLYGNKSPTRNYKISATPDSRISEARARRRAKMYSSSPDRSFRGTSSEEEESPKMPIITKDNLTHNKMKKSLNSETMNTNRKMNFSHKLLTHHLQEDDDTVLQKNNKKFPRLLEPLDIHTKRRKRRKSEVLTSSSMSYSTSPEPTQRRKTFGSFVPQLNLQNWRSTDRSLLSTNREEEEQVFHQRELDVDELVETLSNISVKPNIKDGGRREFRAKSVPASSRAYKTQIQREEELELEQEEREEASRTFRIDKETCQTPKPITNGSKQMPWELKPTNAVTNLVSRRSETSICPFNSHSNASTQVNMRSSLSSLQNSRQPELPKKSQDRFPFTISETSTLSPRHHYKNHHHHPDHMIRNPSFQVSTAEVIYQNKNCRYSSSSDSTSTFPSSTDKNVLSSSKMMSSHSKPSRNYEQDDQWAQSVSYLPSDGNKYSQDRYSVFFVKDARVENIFQGNHEDHLPCVHKTTCRHVEAANFGEKSPQIQSEDFEEDLDVDLAEECFCLKFCNLFRKRSQMMSK